MARKKRILVVDDNAMNREILEEILADEYEVLMATNGLDAVMMAKRYRPAVVLLDVMLPGIDGYRICRKLRSMPEMGEVRIVMVTAKAMPSERAQGFGAGADAYVTKPFDDGDLVAAIRATPALDSAWRSSSALMTYNYDDGWTSPRSQADSANFGS